MVSSSKPPPLQNKREVAKQMCKNETHIHVIVCSCSSSALTKELRFPGAKTHITSIPELSHLSDFISQFSPYDSTNLNLSNKQNYLQFLSRGSPQAQDFLLRSKKYIRNPLRIFGLANRVRIYSSGLLNSQLWFNLFVVIAWLLIRRTLEIFGIHLPGLAVTSQNQQIPRAKSNKINTTPVNHPKEHDLVYLENP
ncbi:hypothetical protein N431DRAFT_409984 [Stipitochalara longipes BDJ]|nr:hypothetical protein N431DRAFT_409984 [Stipitochalara longipes BDJ]